MSEKPLHVKVAEALGTNVEDKSLWGWNYEAIPRYDTDWSATGPLIERQRVAVVPWKPVLWRAFRAPFIGPQDEVYVHEDHEEASGETPLLAVCNLILALNKAGKLGAEQPADSQERE